MMSEKIIVTGGAGFIGSHTVVELSNAGFEPVIIDNFCTSERFIIDRVNKIINNNVKVYDVDCRDKDKIAEIFHNEKPSGIIHFAAFKSVNESVRFPEKYYDNNINSLLTILRAMKTEGIKDLVFSSSCTVYGQPDQIPVNENTPLKKASSPYGETKVICEQKLMDFEKGHPGTRIAILRYFNPIGAHPSGLIGELPVGAPSNLVPFITQTAAGWHDQVIVHGNDYDTEDGTCIRDFIHVVDLAKAHVSALQFLHLQKTAFVPEIYNLGAGKGVSILQAIQAFEKRNNLKLNYSIGPRRKGDVEKIYAIVDKVNKRLGWKCEYTLEDAMEHAWKWQKTLKQPA